MITKFIFAPSIGAAQADAWRGRRWKLQLDAQILVSRYWIRNQIQSTLAEDIHSARRSCQKRMVLDTPGHTTSHLATAPFAGAPRGLTATRSSAASIIPPCRRNDSPANRSPCRKGSEERPAINSMQRAFRVAVGAASMSCRAGVGRSVPRRSVPAESHGSCVGKSWSPTLPRRQGNVVRAENM